MFALQATLLESWRAGARAADDRVGRGPARRRGVLVPLAGGLAAVEAALVRVSAARVEEMERGGDRRAGRLLRVLADRPGTPTCCCCCG